MAAAAAPWPAGAEADAAAVAAAGAVTEAAAAVAAEVVGVAVTAAVVAKGRYNISLRLGRAIGWWACTHVSRCMHRAGLWTSQRIYYL